MEALLKWTSILCFIKHIIFHMNWRGFLKTIHSIFLKEIKSLVNFLTFSFLFKYYLNLFVIICFIFRNYLIWDYYVSLSSLLSSNPPPSPLLSFLSCSVYIMWRACMCSSVTVWYWISNCCVLLWGRKFLSLSGFLSCLQIFK